MMEIQNMKKVGEHIRPPLATEPMSVLEYPHIPIKQRNIVMEKKKNMTGTGFMPRKTKSMVNSAVAMKE